MTFPPIYRSVGPVTGLPLNWRDETSGILPRAVERYLANRIDGTSIDEIDLEMVRAFLEHYINAPCWNHMNQDEELAAELAGLRRDALTLKTPDEMGAWIGRCLDIGIDPL
jgi:hypothetical protein